MCSDFREVPGYYEVSSPVDVVSGVNGNGPQFMVCP